MFFTSRDFQLILKFKLNFYFYEDVSVARIFRIGRVLRLINKAETLRTMFLTLVYSIPSLWNIGCLLFVRFFVYAVTYECFWCY